MTRGSERQIVPVIVKGEQTFVIKLDNDELRQFRAKAEKQMTIFGDGTFMSGIRASDMLSIVEELLQRRKNDGF